jgi:hypothetical protein
VLLSVRRSEGRRGVRAPCPCRVRNSTRSERGERVASWLGPLRRVVLPVSRLTVLAVRPVSQGDRVRGRTGGRRKGIVSAEPRVSCAQRWIMLSSSSLVALRVCAACCVWCPWQGRTLHAEEGRGERRKEGEGGRSGVGAPKRQGRESREGGEGTGGRKKAGHARVCNVLRCLCVCVRSSAAWVVWAVCWLAVGSR